MKKNILRVIVSIVVIIFVFSAGVWTGISFDFLEDYLKKWQSSITGEVYDSSGQDSNLDGADSQYRMDTIEEVMELILGNSMEEKSKEALLQVAIEGMLLSLGDDYAEYFTDEEYEKIMESYSGTMSGIGVVVTLDDEERVVVVRVIEGTPAYATDIREGDIITRVEGVNIKDMDLEKIVAMIKGKEGTDVNLTIYRPSDDSTFLVAVTRAKFDIPNLITEIYEQEIGYVWYYDFQISGVEQLDKEIQRLIDSGARGLILDLRNNPGGAWDDAVSVCDLFLNEGKIVTVKGRLDNEERSEEFFAREGKYTEIPMVVLINGYSASASELVAGALKDNDRAVLVGERSFGKGLVQALYELSDGSGVKFTTAEYFLPSGVSVEGVGIRPDIVIELELDAEEDVQLNRAIEEMELILSGNK
jgi:carboxyl-terminal processing protease